MRVQIVAASSAHPGFRLGQAEAACLLGKACREPRRIAALARGTCIDQRALSLTPGEIAALGSTAERNRLYATIAPGLARQAAAKALGESRDVDCLVSTSCTGYMVPGWDVALQQEMSLPSTMTRLPITEAGCAGGVLALARAADYLRARPGSRALAVSAEVCSLSFNAIAEEGNLISALVFGDGAGAAVLESGDMADGLEVVDSLTYLAPGTNGLLGFDLTDRGFYPVLGRSLVEALPGPTARAAGTLLGRHGLGLEDVSFWLLHPGGARILQRLEHDLALPRCATRWSWESMREFGNTSSAAVLDVLRRFLEDPAAPGGYGLMAAFGPGVSIEMLLLRR